MATIHAGNTARKSPHGPYWHPVPIAEVLVLRDETPNQLLPPLVSCIMPTRDRRPFVELALRHFLTQDYPNKELVVVDDGGDAISDLFEGLPGIHLVRLTVKASIGAKRNLACEHAQGEVIVHWDDDDWYSSTRLREQVAPILRREADMTGLHNNYLLEVSSGDFWTCEDWLHRRMFVGDVHGGTLAFRRSLLDTGVRYPDIDLAEDALFIRRAQAAGRRLARIPNPGIFVYVRHGRNAWAFTPGRFLNPAGWHIVTPPATFPDSALSAYQRAAILVRES
jgi:glycosyltransferase involved in cell wall biosynthesis